MKLLITDLDNTLLRSDKSISPYTAAVFARCREQGILTAFATARAEGAMSRFVETIRPYAILSNGGATVRMNREIIHENWMSPEDVHTILEMSIGFSGGRCDITARADDGYYCNHIPDDPDRRATSIYTDFRDFRKPASKVTVELEREEWAQAIVARCPACTYHSFTGELWRRFAAKGSDKETALTILAEYLCLDMADIIAFGDDVNDLGMLRAAGTAVAVANAIDEVKAVADYVTDSNDEDGVARFIEAHILHQSE
ncbi:MAG: HAD family hydrolase [Clostridia bacterium]|nr:HAD family hydrolase [Clostridia bacterium]